jgi:hypothetical protein
MMLAYFDCFSGISGDMTLGALMDLGVPLEWLKKALTDIPLNNFEISVKKENRHGIQANRVQVAVTGNPMSRNYADIQKLIENSQVSSRVKQTGMAVFDKIAAAEAKIHHVPKNQIHFHEVGAVDSLVDILGVALCLEYLDIGQVVSSKIPLGKGFVTCSHGTLPVPAPATVEILKHIPVFGSSIEQEIVTPTGAAIIAAIADGFGDMPEMEIESVGYGAGLHDIKTIPNLLRVIKGVASESFRPFAEEPRELIVIVETCIDDMNPEFYGYIMAQLFKDGALDVYFIPIFMKKNRPGTLLQVLCEPDKKQTIIHRILSETTAIGLRYYDARRQTLHRETLMVSTQYGDIQAKKIRGPGNRVRIVPEYEACLKVANEFQIPLGDVYAEISAASPAIALTKPVPDCRDES